jgi:hypothetical protein
MNPYYLLAIKLILLDKMLGGYPLRIIEYAIIQGTFTIIWTLTSAAGSGIKYMLTSPISPTSIDSSHTSNQELSFQNSINSIKQEAIQTLITGEIGDHTIVESDTDWELIYTTECSFNTSL